MRRHSLAPEMEKAIPDGEGRRAATANEAVADLDRSRLAAGSFADTAADLPIPAIMLAIYNRGAEQIWCDQGWMAGDKAANALPPVGRAWV